MKSLLILLLSASILISACSRKKSAVEAESATATQAVPSNLGAKTEKSNTESLNEEKNIAKEVPIKHEKMVEEVVFVYSDLRKEIQKASMEPIESKLIQQKLERENKLVAPAKNQEAPYLLRGTDEMKLLRLTNTPFVDERFPDVSFDGKMVTYEAWFKKESGSKFANAIEYLELQKAIKKNVLVSDKFYNLRPSFVPGKAEIVFVSNSWKDEFRVETRSINAQKGVDLALRKYCKNVLGVKFNQFGQALVWYQKDGKKQISLALLKETGELFPEIALGEDASWSPDGKHFLYVSMDGSYQDVYLADADGSGLIRLTTHLGVCSKPSMSPNGQWIVFSAFTAWNKKYDLFVIDRFGNNLSQLTDDKFADLNPVWGRDGWIYFETNRFDQNTEIVKIDPAPLLKKFNKTEKSAPFIE